MIRTVCDHCGARYRVNDGFVGKVRPCPRCKKPFEIRIAAPGEQHARPVAAQLTPLPLALPQESPVAIPVAIPVAKGPEKRAAAIEIANQNLSAVQAISAYIQWFRHLHFVPRVGVCLGLIAVVALACVGVASLFHSSTRDNTIVSTATSNENNSTPADEPNQPPKNAKTKGANESLPDASDRSKVSDPTRQEEPPSGNLPGASLSGAPGLPDVLSVDPEFFASSLRKQLVGKWVHSQGMPWVSKLQINEDGSVVFQPGTQFPYSGVCRLLRRDHRRSLPDSYTEAPLEREMKL